MSVEELKQKIHEAVEKSNNEDQLIRILDVLKTENEAVPDWHKQVLEERWEAYQKNPNEVISLEDWRKKIAEKYGI